MKNGLIIDVFGTKWWYKDNLFHNENGPAVEYSNGSKFWYINGKRHRLDGPAVEYPSGDKEWWYEGFEMKCSSLKEFKQLIKLKVLW